MAYENLYLPERSMVGGRYMIGRVIAANGDGITYLAYDTERKATVEVREFLPDTICIRKEGSTHLLIKQDKREFYNSCLHEFLDMWRKLARMRGLNALILVIDIVEENNTAYAVCEHIEGAVTLRDYLLSSAEGYISWEEARMLFMPMLSTLSTLHTAGIIHRGISPNTLLVDKNGKLIITGFSIKECREINSGIAAEVFAGYAPVEQFGVKSPFGPWTDIYAFAAVLYRALIGSTPIESTVRMQNDKMMIPAKFAEMIPAYVINALINALQILPEDRTKTIEQLREELSASPTATIAADYEPEPVTPVEEPKPLPKKPKKTGPKKSKAEIKKDNKNLALKAGAIAAAVVILIFIILCLTVLRDNFGNGEASNEPTTSAVSKVTVPTFEGRTYASITSQKYDLTIKKTEEYSDEVNKNYVISQSIKAGTEVNAGTEIELVVSLGVEEATMIDVSGKTYDEAKAALEEKHFTNFEKIEIDNDGTHTSNTVDSTKQKVGDVIEVSEKITLYVYGEKATETTTKTN